MKTKFTYFVHGRIRIFLATTMFFLLTNFVASAQLGTYSFNGPGTCPNQNPNVNTQPSGAVFSAFTTTGTNCYVLNDVFATQGLNTTPAINLTQYNEFRITPNAYYSLTLTSLSFTDSTSENSPGGSIWSLRSSLDNYTTDLGTGTASTTVQTGTVNLPAGSFTNIGSVNFRLYIFNANSNLMIWALDNVNLYGSVNPILPANPANPVSNSPQCNPPGVQLSMVGSAPVGETWYWQTSAAGTSTLNSGSTYLVSTSGTYYLRSLNNTTLAWSAGAGSLSVTVTPPISTPVFTLGATSSRCQAAGTVIYYATSTGATGVTYGLDGPSTTGGNSINPATGAVTYAAGWSGTSTITATATGCNGPKTGSHVVTTNGNVTTPVFILGTTSIRCQGAATVTYTATASNTTGISYSLDATTNAFPGNAINTSTGAVTYAAGWSGTSTVTASAAGCTGPFTSVHSVTTTPTVGTPVFSLGATSTRCQGAGTVSYTATSTNNTGLVYSLDAASITGGNSINGATGDVTYVAGWAGNSIITATANGCNGPKSSNHTVTTNGPVGIPVFALGSTSIRCQSNSNVTYSVSALNNAGISWSIDAATSAGGNTINSGTGLLNYRPSWSGTTIITATATGCNGPTSAVHTVTTTQTIGIPVFNLGASSTRCQGAGITNYDATSTNSTSISYSLDFFSTIAGNTINSSTGDVTYVTTWSGTSIITASAAGCNGPTTANHTVTITPNVGTPSFTLGSTSIRCQGATTITYTASATNNTGITYVLDAASITGGNTINPANGAVTYAAGWVGTSVITATATGCNGPRTASHTVTINPSVVTPVFTLGATSIRCQGSGPVSYIATATNTTGITYSLDGASQAGGNSINSGNGTVTWSATWSGTSNITASAAGCNGPLTAVHTVTITPTVGTPVFAMGASSIRCQGAGTVNYTATSTNNTGLSYALDATSVAAGNTISPSTGDLTFTAAWTGVSVITATATGCNGPKSATHIVTTKGTVATPLFALGASSIRCQGAGIVTYTASAANTTGITYSIDAGSLSAGNTVLATTGKVTYVAGWSGTSTVTATAAGCSGPTTAVHTVTVTPTVGTPIFVLGASSVRCQGAGAVTYTLSATNNTGITYNLDAASLAAGNSIITSNGTVTYLATWSGTSTIIGIATGCNGPTSSSHVVTITPTVGIPVFALGLESVRNQGAGTITYTANATNSTSITYTLDPASMAGGNTINAATGVVTWAAAWNGTSLVTATAAGCNGPTTASHFITINATIVTAPLYFSDPGQTLDRIDPVATGISTTVQTGDLSSSATTSVTFTQNPALCSDLVIKAQTISVVTYLNITNGSMPANPSITATLSYAGNTIITLNNPVYNSGSKMLTWSGVLPADVTVPSGQPIALQITTAQTGVVFRIQYHSSTYPSRISLLPVSTFIDISSFNIYSASYPNGSPRNYGVPGNTFYARAVVTTPFGYKDITGLTVNINPPGSNVTATCVDSTTCTRTYEYAWTVPAGGASYFLMATAKEGYENIIKNSNLVAFNSCIVCAPVAVDDSISGAGGAPIIVDVLANDYDPNNNIKVNTLSVYTQPHNGSGYLSNGKVVYLPNGAYAGLDTLTYRICDSTGLCAIGNVFITINPFLVDPCSEATKTHVYYMPFSENEARIALDSSSNSAFPSNNIRTVISLKMPYPGMIIVWDQWEDGYEVNPLNPLQSSTQVWGDGNPYNGIAPGYPDDIIPAGGSIILDNTMATNPRVASSFYYDGRDKVYASGQITMTQVCGEPSIMSVQCMKTNVSAVGDYGTSFTVPVGQDFNSQDFRYTSLFIRASQNNTTINIDKDNNGTFETTAILNEGQVYFVNGGVLGGATITATAPVGIDLHFGGHDSYSSRDVPIFPATWYYNTYYSPVPTTGRAQNPADTNAVYLYNSLNRPLTINYQSGIPSSGTINIPAKTTIRFPLPVSQTAAYKFWNPTGESFTAIQVCDSYTPGGGGNSGVEFDWSFNLIAQNRLTDFATVAWAPGSIDGTRDDNPIWVTPTNNTTIYVKYNGNISGSSGLLSPCGMRYDVSYPLNVLNHKRLLDLSDNDQSGLAVFTCDGTKLAAVYGEDPSTAVTGSPSWDVGSTIQPFCKQKLIFANDDYARTMINQPVTIAVLVNDFGFLAVVDPTTVTNTGLLQPHHGSIFINQNGTINYTPNPGYVGKDTFEYNVCSTPTPVVCDNATVYVDIAVCPAPLNQNIIGGTVFLDKNGDGINNDGGIGVAGVKVYLYVDGNCNTIIDPNELKDSVTVDASGAYQFTTYPERFVADDFDGPGGTNTCATGSDGNASWLTNWVDQGDPSVGYCNNSQTPANTDAEIKLDQGFSYALRLKDKNVSATREVNLSGASYAFLTFSFRRKSATMTVGHNLIVQASSNGSTFGTIYTITGNGAVDAGYTTIYNQDITAYASATTYIRFLTNGSMVDADTVYIDNVKVQYIRYPLCYMTSLSSSTIPPFTHTTTATQHNMTATNATTCLAPFDFGIAKNTVMISGTLFNDANGLTDNLVNGSPNGYPGNATVYAYLIDSTNTVVMKTTVGSSNGTWNFASADVMTSYSVGLSTYNLVIGGNGPIDANMPALWLATGDSYGLNNQSGTGIKPGSPTCSVPVKTGALNVTAVNFGCERVPDSDPKSNSYTINVPGQQYTLPGLTGTDPEDGVLGTGNTFKITTLPNNAVLYYNGAAVILNQVITSFTPSLFKIDPDDTTIVSTFTYASVDAALQADPTPATVTVNWLALLPITSLEFTGKLNGSKVNLNWKTGSEVNSDHFELEKSTDGVNFIMLANVKAKGNSSIASYYGAVDPLPVKGLNYYRLKMIDIDGRYVYSQVIVIRVNDNITLTTAVKPNPFTNSLDVYVTIPHASAIELRLVDVTGKTVYFQTVKGNPGFNAFSINDLSKLSKGTYILQIVSDDSMAYEKMVKQ